MSPIFRLRYGLTRERSHRRPGNGARRGSGFVNREIKIEVCINTANGKPRLEVSGHAFEVCCTISLRFMWPEDCFEDYSNMAAAGR